MAKRLRPCSEFALRKCDEKINYLEDRISQLPDDVLISIVSRLTLKEGARTGVLSNRWKELWTYTTGSLDFDASRVFWKLKEKQNEELLRVERLNYVSWVNQVLNSHKGATIDELRVCFDLNARFSLDIYNWIKFATHKRVKRLELYLKGFYNNLQTEFYSFSASLLNFESLHSLTAIHLTHVNVTRGCLESFFSNCPLLEELCVVGSQELFSVQVFGQSLRRLTIVDCCNLEYIDSCARNLVYFRYDCPKSKLILRNAYNLSEVSFGGKCCKSIIHKFCRLSSFLSQLQTLVLDMHQLGFMRFPKCPKLTNLKQLRLIMAASGFVNIHPCISLIKAFPCLYRFSLELIQQRPTAFHAARDPAAGHIIAFLAARHHHAARHMKVKKRLLKSPKVVELVGFTGYTAEVELAKYLLANVESLEKITIDTRDPFLIGSPLENVEDEFRLAAKKCAVELETKRSPGTELVII